MDRTYYTYSIVLSTAHPCKFPDATNNAINKHEKLPKELQHVLDKNENFQVSAAHVGSSVGMPR